MFQNKKIYISPYSKTSDVLRKKLLDKYKNAEFLGFIDKNQIGKDIFKFDDIKNSKFDYILIHSPNHFEDIYKDYKSVKKRILKVKNIDNEYVFLNYFKIKFEKISHLSQFFREFIFKNLAKFYDNFSRRSYVFISKNFINGNNKFLYLTMCDKNIDCFILSNNKSQIYELKQKGFKALKLDSMQAYIKLAKAKFIIVDQGDNSHILNLKSKNQKTLQMWHGIPLEHMNLLTDITYDYFLSTSEFVSKTGFSKVFLAKNFLDLGYPRNDILLKEKYDEKDLIFTDKKLFNFIKETKQNNKKIIIYMPTWRESDFNSQKTQIENLNLDFDLLDSFLIKNDIFFIIKFHPFVYSHCNELLKSAKFKNIVFHDAQGDIYPLLKFADILAGDYSSVYYDFLLLNKPLLFYLYDHGKCSKMAHGYIYEFDDYSPGEKAFNQDEFLEKITKILNGNDEYKFQREELAKKLFKFQDSKSSDRIIEVLKQ
ncbi:CDP-glycerol glycerophosphotransferase family protein [Campylobacter sputorum]|uniref:CDP-glycerol glycerophosphotransferase family protein n=1 Tax=Campylobacter sputorum TaxID=206 RepID=UPI00053BEDCF|nr:CDP-glycerol glycerophosphotransferase family protein [Campylobacter sputorum]